MDGSTLKQCQTGVKEIKRHSAVTAFLLCIHEGPVSSRNPRSTMPGARQVAWAMNTLWRLTFVVFSRELFHFTHLASVMLK